MNNKFTYHFFRYLYALFYIVAGINHFISPDGYMRIMPNYLPAPLTLIYISGVTEILFAILTLFSTTQKFANFCIIAMLIAFLPAHIYMIELAPFHLGNIEITPLIAWARIPIQFLLILWAWFYTRRK